MTGSNGKKNKNQRYDLSSESRDPSSHHHIRWTPACECYRFIESVFMSYSLPHYKNVSKISSLINTV